MNAASRKGLHQQRGADSAAKSATRVDEVWDHVARKEGKLAVGSLDSATTRILFRDATRGRGVTGIFLVLFRLVARVPWCFENDGGGRLRNLHGLRAWMAMLQADGEKNTKKPPFHLSTLRYRSKPEILPHLPLLARLYWPCSFPCFSYCDAAA